MPSTPSTSQYDTIGSRYTTIKKQQGSSLELAAIQTHGGDITGLHILDLACGLDITAYANARGMERASSKSARVRCGAGDVDTDADADADADAINEHPEIDFYVAVCSTLLENLEGNSISCSRCGFSIMRLRRKIVGMWRNIFAFLVSGGRWGV
ncbi:hypothetical protein BOTNAR_0378g00030 [Botryotinia narcissicola]|uniref:Uncharacterized protein n=1 Tax=Botryotinia narcissicola TaxID=278944 RepID=A0A4Z1HNZ4_9HELO|nr:hypothetical protein BOTNAR_0378g00030 [Botryotinia narcissicola]